MNAASLVRRLHQHRMWANHHLLEASSSLSMEQLRQPFEIGQGTLWRTLCHLYAADYVWLAALNGEESCIVPGDVAGKLPGNQEADDAMTSLDQLRNRWQQLDDDWKTFLDQLADENLDRPVRKVSSSSFKGQPIETPAYDVLLHVCTHAQYTVAQAMNMLRQLGMEKLPPSMLITLAREERLR